MLSSKVTNTDQMQKLNELNTLQNLRPCLDSDLLLRVERSLKNSELRIDTKQPFLISSKRALIRLIILHIHVQAGHVGSDYTLMQSRQQFWIIFGSGSVKYYLPIAQSVHHLINLLLTDLLFIRGTKPNKPFRICKVDFLWLLYRQGRSKRKNWGLLFNTYVINFCI